MGRSVLLPLLSCLLVFAGLTATAPRAAESGVKDYYHYPALHGDTIVFTAEGDLWSVSADGGRAARLTSHPDRETRGHISPDGKTLAFTGHYEGPSEVYTMPLGGGLPIRQTYEGRRAYVQGWTPEGKVLYETGHFSALPDYKLATLDPAGPPLPAPLPLSQAAEGTFASDGTLVFTRQHFQGSHTKRYVGGTAQNIWRFKNGQDREARCLTCDYKGTSKNPRFMDGRVYFLSDRDGTMNLWSMTPDGADLTQHTRHSGWDIVHMSAQGGRVAYALQADLWLWQPGQELGTRLDITLPTDTDQRREKWVSSPNDYLSATHLSHDGKSIVLTARGEVFTKPVKGGRLAQVTRAPGVRYRNARFMPEGTSLLAMSDESGEVEFWTLPANGDGPSKQITRDGHVLRFAGIPSPDGKWIGSHDKNGNVWVHNFGTGESIQVWKAKYFYASDLTWSPDSRYLAMLAYSRNNLGTIYLFDVQTKALHPVTSDRVSSYSPAFSPDGKFLWFLSDRDLKSATPSPWGPYQPDPFLDKPTRIYGVSLSGKDLSPFLPATELDEKTGNGEEEEEEVRVVLNLEGITERVFAVPAPRDNYGGLAATKGALFTSVDNTLKGLAIDPDDHDLETVASSVGSFELSGDGKSLLLTKRGTPYVVPAKPKKASLDDAAVDLSGWAFTLDPREEWRQMFIEAWRLERDYFYDPNMHGTDWQGILKKHLPLVERITDRAELQDLISLMVGELSALHIYVYGGDFRPGPDNIGQGHLGAAWQRDEKAGGYRITHVYRGDPDFPQLQSPLAELQVNIREGDLIRAINGVSLMDVRDPGQLLRNQVGNQVLLEVKPGDGSGVRKAVVTPISAWNFRKLRYNQWKYTRRLMVDEASEKTMAYVHLSAMGGGNFSEFAREFYPVFDRQGLILDVRHNGGGNIDSWILSKLIREVWMYWQSRMSEPYWNMQFAFPGHMVVLVDEETASDGEAFADGFRRLELGPVIGTRTWGGEIWLTSSNVLVDGGIATAAEMGVYGPEGEWLIEGEGVVPDQVVDNLPHETFQGKDRQLEAAIAYLRKKIVEEPVVIPDPPPFPDKSFTYPQPEQ